MPKPTTRILTIDRRGVSGAVSQGGFVTTPSKRLVYRVKTLTLPKKAGVGPRGPHFYRMVLERIPRDDVPDGTKLAIIRNGWRPSQVKRTADGRVLKPAGDPSPEAIRKRRQAGEAAQYRRAKDLLADDRNSQRPVPTVRTKTITAGGKTLREATAEPAEWVDPDDMAPNRRVARRIQGHRATDVLITASKRHSQITRRHISAANKLRADYDVGVLGAMPGYERPPISTRHFGPSSGPQEIRTRALMAFEKAREAVGPSLFAILDHVVLQNHDATTFRKLGRSATGYLVAALDALSDFFFPPKEQTAR